MRALSLAVGGLVLALLGPLGCDHRETGLMPVGAEEVEGAHLARFVRRLHLDLSGTAPAEATLKEALGRLVAEGNTAATRAALADELLTRPAFAAGFIADLEGRVFAGLSQRDAYQLLCANVRNFDPACQACAPAEDACSGCSCRQVAQLSAERERLAGSAEDLLDLPSSDIERRYAGAQVYRLFFGTQQAVTTALFRDFLLREPEPDELRNGGAMVVGAILDARAPAGVLFHQYGRSYGQLVDILFSSEVYSEALVERVFLRYLGRPPAPAERAHFLGQLALLPDPAKPDLRPLVRAAVSSREYFNQ